MELTPKQQTVELIRKAERLLLLARPSSDGDALGSLVGLGMVLKKLGKEVALVSPDPVPDHLAFLPQTADVSREFAGTRDLVIAVDLTRAPVERVSYRKDPSQKTLEILLTPKSGVLAEEAVAVKQSGFRFDAVIILDTPDLEQLGGIYDEHTQLFFETPIVNIDHHPSNDYFGKVNWVDLTATATAEILVSLTESLAATPGGDARGQALATNEPLWDPDIATALLTGLLWDTQSFQSETTTPKSLTVAAQLIALGARQQEIVKSLFKTRPLSTLRLWGTVLSNLEVDRDHRFVWAAVGGSDLTKAGAQSNEIGGLMDELIKNAPGQELAVIFVEEAPDKTAVLLHALSRKVQLAELARTLGGAGGSNRTLLTLPTPLTAARDDVLSKIRTYQQTHVTTGT